MDNLGLPDTCNADSLRSSDWHSLVEIAKQNDSWCLYYRTNLPRSLLHIMPIVNALHGFPHIVIVLDRWKILASNDLILIPNYGRGYALHVNFLEHFALMFLLLTWLWRGEKTMNACVSIQWWWCQYRGWCSQRYDSAWKTWSLRVRTTVGSTADQPNLCIDTSCAHYEDRLQTSRRCDYQHIVHWNTMRGGSVVVNVNT